MAVTASEHVTPETPRPTPTAKRTTSVWTRTSQLRQATPILRLVAAVTAIPHVIKLGVLVDGTGTHVRIIVSRDDRVATALIYQAEREYLNATPLHSFDLHVTPITRLPTARQAGNLLDGFETIFER